MTPGQERLERVRRKRAISTVVRWTVGMIALAIFLAAFVKVAGAAIDERLDNREAMLCHSAEISGNQEWLANPICENY